MDIFYDTEVGCTVQCTNTVSYMFLHFFQNLLSTGRIANFSYSVHKKVSCGRAEFSSSAFTVRVRVIEYQENEEIFVLFVHPTSVS